MENKYKSLALLFAGAFLSVLGGLIVKFQVLKIEIILWVLIPLAFILLLWGSGIISLARHAFNLWRRKGNILCKPKVGILNDMGSDLKKGTFGWTDITPEKWKEEIGKKANKNKLKIKIKFTDVRKNFDSYTSILNPYGSVYPEDDLKDFKTMNKILDYVKEGGLFINVADIPCYWAYSPLLKRTLDTTPPVYNIKELPNGITSIIQVRPFGLTPLMQKLGLLVLNVENVYSLHSWDSVLKDEIVENVGEIKVHRVVKVEGNIEPLIEPKKLGYMDVTPFFNVKYGDGKFLISLIVFDNNNIPENNIMLEAIVKIAIKSIK